MKNLDNNLLGRAFSGISFDPERRAASTRADFNNDVEEYATIVKNLPDAAALIETYRAGLAAHYNKWLASSGRCVSYWIAGPAKFPVRRQQKMMDIEHRRMTELLEWQEHQLKKARALVRKAEGRGPILSSDKEAPEQLRKKIEHLEAVHALVVAANKQIRKNAAAAKQWIAEQRGQHPARVYSDFLRVVAEYAFSACNGGIYGDPVAPYWLSNDSQNIKRLKSRLAEIESKREIFNGENDYEAADGTRVEFDGNGNRIRLIFEDKPEPETREKLKKNGFRWSPNAGAWQSYLNRSCRFFVEKEFPRPPAATLPTLPPLEMKPSPAIRHHATPCCLSCAADLLKMREFKYPDRQTGLMAHLNLRGVEQCTSWRELHDENGILKYTTAKGADGKIHRVYKFRHLAESFLRFSATLDSAAQMNSCNGGNIAGFNGRNPERICSMAALWGMADISGQLFRTPADWKKAGYELKDTARPFFVVTPKFTEKTEKEQDEETGEEVESVTITGSAGQYNIFPVYCSADVRQVRTVKRRTPREKKPDAELDALATAYKAARQKVATIAAATGAPSGAIICGLVTGPRREKAPAVHPADREHMRQMALAL